MREMLKRGTILKNRYVIREIIGSGGFSYVYRAWDQLLFRRVAIKELVDDTWREDFLREAAIMDRLGNIPSVTQIYDSFSENATEYIVMNLIEGSSLYEYVQEKGGALTVAEVLPMMEKILYALQQIHALGYLHRDICPNNILRTKDGDVYLIDFGAATAVNRETDHWNGRVYVHKNFHAPEHDTPMEQGTWTDIYSVCATLVFLLTGTSVAEEEERLVYDPIPQQLTRTGLVSRQQNAVMKGLELNWRERCTDACELRLALCRELEAAPDTWKISYAAKTDVGSRKNNQDNLMVDGLFYFYGDDFERAGELKCREELHMAAVCDGVGGAAAGEISSLAAIQALVHFLEGYRFCDTIPERLLDELLDQMNEKIVSLGRKIGKTATTVSFVLWKGRHFYAVNIGDSPIYLFRKKKLTKISIFHRLSEEKLLRGEEINLTDTHILTRYLGKENTAGSQMKALVRGHIEEGDKFLICTDGVPANMTADQLKKCLRQPPEKAMRSIWKILNKKKRDNCSVVVLEFSGQ